MDALAFVKYLRVPLSTAPLLVTGCFTILLMIAQIAGITGIPLALIIVSWFFKYSFVLLDYVADGHREMPALSMEMVNPVEQRPFGLFLLMLIFYVGTMWLEPYFGESGVRVLRVAALSIVPAMVAVMSISGRFFAALDPSAVFAFVARIPISYALLIVLIAALWLAPTQSLRMLGVALTHVGFGSPSDVLGAEGLHVGFLGIALFMFLWLAMCACIGGIVYEHRHELGFEPMHSPERSAAKEQAELDRMRDKLMDGVFAELRGGALGNAGATVRAIMEKSPQPLNEFRWLYARASRWPDQRLAAYLVQWSLSRLLDARATGEALDLVRERLRHDATFRPNNAGETVRLAQLARTAGDRITARALLADFEQRFPNDAAAMLAAQLNEQLQR